MKISIEVSQQVREAIRVAAAKAGLSTARWAAQVLATAARQQ